MNIQATTPDPLFSKPSIKPNGEKPLSQNPEWWASPICPWSLPRQSPLWESVLGGGCPLASLAGCHSGLSLSPTSPTVKEKGSVRDRMGTCVHLRNLPPQLGSWVRQRCGQQSNPFSRHWEPSSNLRKNTDVTESSTSSISSSGTQGSAMSLK